MDNQFDRWSDDLQDSVPRDVHEDFENKSEDAKSNDDHTSSSHISSDQSSTIERNFQRGFRLGSTVLPKNDRSKSYSRYSNDRDLIIESQFRETELLHFLSASGFPMTQVNGQRKLGPPPGWSKPPPDPSCEVFVGGIPRTLYEYEIYPIFQKIGKVYEIRLMMDFSSTNRGYCFVMFSKFEYAKRAVKELNNYEIRPGRRIGVVESINNCRLCIRHLLSDIDSELVIRKFYEITDEVSKVAVYKNANGQVRYALVSYKTHRGAAMARRRLLPDRENLFAGVEVSIDWAHPDTSPNNMVEESGFRDENGKLQISRVMISEYPKLKIIKNHLQDKSGSQSIKNHGKSSDCSSLRSQKFARGNSVSARRRGGRGFWNPRKYGNPSFRDKGFKKKNNDVNRKETSIENFQRDINRNLTKSKNNQRNRADFYNGDYEADNTSATNQKDDRVEELNSSAKNFVPNNAFNLFAQYSPSSEKQGSDYWGGSVPNVFQDKANHNGKAANFAEFGKWNSTESFVPKFVASVSTQQNEIELRPKEVIGTLERLRIDCSQPTKRDPHKNFRNAHEKENVPNYGVIQRPVTTTVFAENGVQNSCQECINFQMQFSLGIPGEYQQNQPWLPGINPGALNNSLSAWRGTNDFAGNQIGSVDRCITRPLSIPLPQSYIKTPALGDAYHAILPQMYTTTKQIAFRPRPILKRLA